MAGASEGFVALDTLMDRFSKHLDALAEQVFEVEEALGMIIDREGPSDQPAEFILRLQSLDVLRQSLEDLAILSCHMSRQASTLRLNRFATAQAMDALKLRATRQLLAGSNVPLPDAMPAEQTGKLDLF